MYPYNGPSHSVDNLCPCLAGMHDRLVALYCLVLRTFTNITQAHERRQERGCDTRRLSGSACAAGV